MSNAPKPRTTERRVAFLFATYHAEEFTPEGMRREVIRTARRGELVTLPLTEAARLDVLGALAPPGATVADIEADLKATRQAYLEARQQVPDVEGI